MAADGSPYLSRGTLSRGTLKFELTLTLSGLPLTPSTWEPRIQSILYAMDCLELTSGRLLFALGNAILPVRCTPTIP